MSSTACEATKGKLDLRSVQVDGTFAKVHQHATGAPKDDAHPTSQPGAIGRSRGGLTTKMMALVDRNGSLVKFSIRPGNAAEVPEFLPLLDGVHTSEVIADKAYDADSIRTMLAEADITATILPKSNRRVQYEYDREASRPVTWWRISLRTLKQFRGIATRYCKLGESYVAFIQLVPGYQVYWQDAETGRTENRRDKSTGGNQIAHGGLRFRDKKSVAGKVCESIPPPVGGGILMFEGTEPYG